MLDSLNTLFNFFKPKTIHVLFIGATLIYLQYQQINIEKVYSYGWLFIAFWAASATIWIWEKGIILYKSCICKWRLRKTEQEILSNYEALPDCEKAIIDCSIANSFTIFNIPDNEPTRKSTIASALSYGVAATSREFQNFQKDLYKSIKNLEVLGFGKTDGEDYILFELEAINIIRNHYGKEIYGDFFDKKDNEYIYILTN